MSVPQCLPMCSSIAPNIWTPLFFFFNDTATTEIYTLSLHDALPIFEAVIDAEKPAQGGGEHGADAERRRSAILQEVRQEDRKSTRLNSSHVEISYAVFCLKKKKRRCLSSIRLSSAATSSLTGCRTLC